MKFIVNLTKWALLDENNHIEVSKFVNSSIRIKSINYSRLCYSHNDKILTHYMLLKYPGVLNEI